MARASFRLCSVLALSVLLIFSNVSAHADSVPASGSEGERLSPEMEARLRVLEQELRCLVCQNQTLADSPAGLAGDLRREVRLLANAGKSNEEIKSFLQARYGDFVLYKPPVQNTTALLWYGPFLLLAIGAGVLVTMLMRRRRSQLPAVSAPSDVDRARAASLLEDDSEPPKK